MPTLAQYLETLWNVMDHNVEVKIKKGDNAVWNGPLKWLNYEIPTINSDCGVISNDNLKAKLISARYDFGKAVYCAIEEGR